MLPIRWLSLRLDVPGSPALFDQTCSFWALATGSAATGTDPRRLEPTSGTPYLSLQRTEHPDDAGGTDGRCALEIAVAPGTSLAQARDDALASGAGPMTPARAGQEHGVVQLVSPGGYAFSLTVAVGGQHVVPAAAERGGGLSRVDQVCLDIPPTEFDSECVFWQALTGWPLTGDADSEFAHLQRQADIPIRILLQRRDDAEPDDIVTGHLDFSAEDRKSLAAEHIRAGATLVGEYERWITLRDPAGRVYCLTARTVDMPPA